MAKKTVHRDAGTGKFITKKEADRRPKETVKETANPGRKGGKRK